MSDYRYISIDIEAWLVGSSRMTYEEKGIYNDLLLHCFFNPGLTIDVVVDKMDIDWDDVPTKVKRKFTIKNDGVLINKRLEETRKNVDEIREKRRRSGKKGGLAKAKQSQANAKQSQANLKPGLPKIKIKEKINNNLTVVSSEIDIDIQTSKIWEYKDDDSNLMASLIQSQLWDFKNNKRASKPFARNFKIKTEPDGSLKETAYRKLIQGFTDRLSTNYLEKENEKIWSYWASFLYHSRDKKRDEFGDCFVY